MYRMKTKIILFATIVAQGAIGMDAPLNPILLQGNIEILECVDYVAGFPSRLLRKNANNLCGANLIKEEDICVPVCISLQQDPKKIKLGSKAIDNMPDGRIKEQWAKDLLEVKELTRTPQLIALPAYKLQNHNFIANKGMFSISYAFNQPYLVQETIKALENRPVCFFAYQQEKQSYKFDQKVIRSFDLEKKKIIKPNEKFWNCLESKARRVNDLLQLADRATDKEQKECIKSVAKDIHTQTVHEYFNFPEYKELFSTGDQEKDLVIFKSTCFSNDNLQENMKKRNLEIFSRNNPGQLFNVIQ